MKKWIRRIMLLVATVLVVLLGGLMLAYYLVRSQPAYYVRPVMSEQAARSAEDKIINLQNQAARIAAMTRVKNVATTSSLTLNTNEPVTIVFTADEINSFFEKWSRLNNWKSVYEPYLTDPVIVLRDHRLILAANLLHPEMLVSLHFDVRVDEKGQLQLELARVMGGRLPLPESILGKYEQQLADHVKRQSVRWQQNAKISASGAANASAISASMGKLFAHMLRHEPAEPVLFLPVVGQPGSVPVKILNVQIDDDQIALTVRPMTHDEHAQLLARIRASDTNLESK